MFDEVGGLPDCPSIRMDMPALKNCSALFYTQTRSSRSIVGCCVCVESFVSVMRTERALDFELPHDLGLAIP